MLGYAQVFGYARVFLGYCLGIAWVLLGYCLGIARVLLEYAWVGSGIAWVLISHFSIRDYQVCKGLALSYRSIIRHKW